MNTFERRILGHRLSPRVEEVFFEVGDVGLDVEVGWDGERESLSRFGIEKIVVFWNFLIGGSMRRGSRQVEAGWGIGERGFWVSLVWKRWNRREGRLGWMIY